MVDIRLPNINASTEAGQLQQIRVYLYQFAEQLNWALNTLETNQGGNSVVLQDAAGNKVSDTDGDKAQETFNSIKNLIIKSADIVEAYYDKIDKLIELKGKYVAQSDFGKYTEETSAKISMTSQYVEQKFKKTETIDGNPAEYSFAELEDRIRAQEGAIRSGLVKTTLHPLGEDYGIEVCAINASNGNETKRVATFTASGIELYAGTSSTVPVVTISKEKIKINGAEFTESVKMGKYRIDLSNGMAFKWEGV